MALYDDGTADRLTLLSRKDRLCRDETELMDMALWRSRLQDRSCEAVDMGEGEENCEEIIFYLQVLYKIHIIRLF